MHVSKIHLPTRALAIRFLLYGALAFALVLAFSGVASAQDTYRVTYFDFNGATGAPDAIVHILNPGVVNPGQLCASIYVWRNDQELSECCSCPITPNGLLRIRVSQLTNNPGDHAGNPFAGSIAIISDSACDATNPTPTADLRSWATHINFNTFTEGFDVTETATLDTPLSDGEKAEASGRCGFIRINGSGAGRCDRVCVSTGA